jgi:hypothetical protein
MSLRMGTLPSDWRKANVIPVHKSGDEKLITNYRPISLLSVISKVLERCVHNRIYPIISDKLHDSQHGFMKGRSTCTQLVEFTDDIGKILDKSGQVDVFYLDFSKAFDTVPHALLLKKLSMLGMGNSLFKWFKSYLSNRYQRVIINGVHSQWLSVTSGVPQGSILGPLLFLMYVSDINLCLKYCKVKFFADDAKIYITVNDIRDCYKLQEDLYSLIKWTSTWGMTLNLSKCKILTITHKLSPIVYEYSISNVPIERCECIRDLGVLIDTNLSWSEHVTKVVNNAFKTMGIIKRTLGYNAPTTVMRLLYLTMVRSILEYNTPVWNSLSKRDIMRLERVQRSATRFILKFPDIDYHQRLVRLNMLPLAMRRDYFDICLFFKYLTGIIFKSEITNYVTFVSNEGMCMCTRSSTDPYKLNMPICNTVFRQKMFFVRIIHLWNFLTPELRTLNETLLDTFKKHLKTYLLTLLYNQFDPNDVCTWVLSCRCSRCRLQ